MASFWRGINREKVFGFRLFRLALLGTVVYARGMECEIGTDAEAKELLAAALTGRLTDVQSKALAALSPEVVSLAFLAASQRIAELESKLKVATVDDPATPSGQKPLYAKPTRRKSKRKPGARKGHAPARRKTPDRIDRREDHRLEVCPDCGGPLQRCTRTRTRTMNRWGRMIRSERFKYCVYDAGATRESLVDMTRDTGEMKTLTSDPEYKEALAQHRRYLSDWIKQSGDREGSAFVVQG